MTDQFWRTLNLSAVFLDYFFVDILPRVNGVLVFLVRDKVEVGGINVALNPNPFNHAIIRILLRERFDVLTEAMS